MSRKLGDLQPCIIYLDEKQVHKPYFYLGLDNGGHSRLLREHALVQRRMHSVNVAAYGGCEADLWLENEDTGFLSYFDEATINALVPTTICYSDYTQSADGTVEYIEAVRRAMFLSYKEYGYGGSETGKSFLPAIEAITGKTANNARICYTESLSAVHVWMSSGYSASQFRLVYTNGSAVNSYAAIGNFWFRPALSVSPDTLVSDEGADSIFLLPEGRRTYWQIGAVVNLGSSADRPVKAKLLIPEMNIQEATYEISNNAKDENPVWVKIQNGGVADLENTEKETDDWEIAVKIDARGGIHTANVGEPALIVETEEA